jgi:hypothetical protein
VGEIIVLSVQNIFKTLLIYWCHSFIYLICCRFKVHCTWKLLRFVQWLFTLILGSYFQNMFSVSDYFFVGWLTHIHGASNGMIGCNTPQDGRFWVQFPVGALKIFKWHYFWGYWASNRNEYQGISFGVKCGQCWQLWHPSCAECHSKDGSPLFHPCSVSSWVFMGKHYSFLLHTHQVAYHKKKCTNWLILFREMNETPMFEQLEHITATLLQRVEI